MSDITGPRASQHGGARGRDRGPPVDRPAPAPLRAGRLETTERDERIETRDGTGLAARIFLPVLPDGAGPQPAVVVTNGYADIDYRLHPNLRRLARHGYPVVAARLRGVRPSQGRGGLYEQYGSDGYDVIEWTARQPFCDGQVGHGGCLAAGHQPVAGRPAAAAAPGRGGARRRARRHLRLPVAPGRDGAGDRPPAPGRGAGRGVGVRPGRRPPVVRGVLARSGPCSGPTSRTLARSGLPALTSTGWDSYLVDAGSRVFTWLRAAGAGPRARLIIGPWRHAGVFTSEATTYEVAPGDTVAPYTGFETQLLWLDRWLRGERNGIDEAPPVQIFVQGPDQWRYEDDWPLPDERRVRLFLSGTPSGTAASRNDGTLARDLPAAPALAAYDFDPATAANPAAVSGPVVTRVPGGPPRIAPAVLPPGARRVHGRLLLDKTPYEAAAVTWTSAVLARPAEITGFPRLVLWASVSAPEADFVAELTDVAPAPGGGWTSVQVTRGYLRAGAQFSRAGPVALDPGDVYRFEIELQPTSYVVPAGHRVRVTVAGAAIDPAIDVAWQGPGLGLRPFTVTVHAGPGRASYADIPFIGADPGL